jgi:hypothetical protein
MPITVVPTTHNYPLIHEIQGTPADIAQRAQAFFNSADFLNQAGASIEVDEANRKEAREIFNDGGMTALVPTTSAAAIHLKALVTEYDHKVLESNIQARNYIVNRLLDISNPNPKTIKLPTGEPALAPPAKPSEQLKALELLGKVSEIGLFTERLEVNINNKSTEELEAELVATLSKYMGHAIPVTDGKDPLLGVDLDEELGRV